MAKRNRRETRKDIYNKIKEYRWKYHHLLLKVNAFTSQNADHVKEPKLYVKWLRNS